MTFTIGVLSDTHFPRFADEIPTNVLKRFKSVDLILHAGDMIGITALKPLQALGVPIIGVYGNNDYESVKKRYNYAELFEVGGWRIGLTHGHIGDPELRTAERAYNIFKDDDCDLVVYGHKHEAGIERKGKTLLFNPGSCTDVRQKYLSYGVITLGKKVIKTDIIQWKSPRYTRSRS